MNPPIVAKTRRRGITFPAVLVLLVVASSAPAATAQIAVDELELRLSLRRGVAMSSESFHTANPSEKPAQVTISVQDWDRSEAGENRYYPLGTLPTSCASHIKVFPSVLQLDPRSVQTVRVALANILSSVLLELLPAIRDALTADGEAILSGILLDERETMLAALDRGGWRVVAEDIEGAWWTARIARS